MNVRDPDDFGPKSKKKFKGRKVYRIGRILKENTSRSVAVWVTAEVQNKDEPLKGRLLRPDDREWMINCNIQKLDSV